MATLVAIEPHPDSEVTRIELIHLETGSEHVVLVTGKHYRVGQLGVWLKPQAWIPGWLAHDLWLVGKRRSNHPFEVRALEIKGVMSPGLFCGEVYMKDGSEASIQRYNEYAERGGKVSGEWIAWPHWNPSWAPGDAVDFELGVWDHQPDDLDGFVQDGTGYGLRGRVG